MRGDKWLSGANPKLNKLLFSLFAQGFLHNKAQKGNVCSISKIPQAFICIDQDPYKYIIAIRWKLRISKCGDFTWISNKLEDEMI